ncbi:MAG: hypothetical protein O2816_19860, partial [Planctomycetota bacterium]|nr:hypothetical protein [Planctomycetota bacterium]
GGTLAGEGHEEWSALAPGAYTVAVTHAGYPDWTRTIELEGEQRSRLYVQLREEIELRGQVVDRFGAPIPGQQVWCLAAGQTHPFNVEGARHLLGAVADREGRVKLTLPNGGEWRISIGRVAKQELVGQRRTMAHGGPDRFIAVVGGATRLNLEVQFASDPEPLTAIVLQRREDAVADRGDEGGTSLKDVDDPARQERLEKAFSRGDLEVGPNRIDLGDPGAGPTLPDWVNRMSRSVGNDGRVSFEHLLSGREYRLGVVRSGERYESQTSFVLTPDELLTVRARVPASLGPSDEPLVAPLHISLQHGKPGEQDLEPGIHWQ